MITSVEALYKANTLLKLGWNPEPVIVTSYNLYVSLIASVSSMTSLMTGIKARPSDQPVDRGKIGVDVDISDVRTALSLPITVDFSNVTLFFTITYVNSAGITSALADSIIVEIPPVGITTRYRKDDPTVNRFIYGFSEEELKWVKAAASGMGALIVDVSDFYKANIVSEYTYDATDIKTIKSYFSDKTAAGYPAKLTTYTYSGGFITKSVITDTTV